MASKLIMVTLMFCVLYAAVNAVSNKCDVCPCTLDLDPVCGRDGIWYNNMCELDCAGAKMTYDDCCAGEKPGSSLFLTP